MAGVYVPVSVRNIAEFGRLALIFVPGPCSAGKKTLCMSAGFGYFSRPATSRVRRKYGSWSMAQGISAGTVPFGPNQWGKVLLSRA